MLVKLVEVKDRQEHFTSESKQRFFLEEIFINPAHVTYLRADPAAHRQLQEGFMPPDLHKKTAFTRVSLQSGQTMSSIVVVGGVAAIGEKLNRAGNKQLIKG